MKAKLLLMIFVFMLGSFSVSYASFPVKRTAPATNTSEVVEQPQEEVISLAYDASKGKSQIVALILCGLVGGLGIHRFYLGYTWQGIVQLLTLGGCGIWSLIDLIRIITGSLQPKNGRYTKTL
ncbi:MAG: TM2 domain-containing protein [Winogradskyella sp.]